jgi:hypothetical protein
MATHWDVRCPECGKLWFDKKGFINALKSFGGIATSQDAATLTYQTAKKLSDLPKEEKLAMEAQGFERKGDKWVCACGFEAYDVWL